MQYRSEHAIKPPFIDGNEDDGVLLSAAEHTCLLLRDEFEWISACIHYLAWTKHEVPYVQMAREYNEGTGFCDLRPTPSNLSDIDETVAALRTLGNQLGDFNASILNDYGVPLDFKPSAECLAKLVELLALARRRGELVTIECVDIDR